MNNSPATLPDAVDGLIVVDVQTGLLDDETSRVLPVILDRVAAAQSADLPIMLTRFVNDTRSLHRRELGWDGCAVDSEDSRIVPELQSVYSTCPVVARSGYTARGRLADYAQTAQMSRPMIVGLGTDSGVLSCGIELFDNGIPSVIDSSACASLAGTDMHDNAVVIMRRLFGEGAVI